MECTPKEIDARVIDFCNTINEGSQACYVCVKPKENCRENYCYDNVSFVVENNGGKKVGGWIIWRRDNMYLEAEAHAVWEINGEELVDVTPHTPLEENILFIRDNSVEYKGKRIPNKLFPLTDSKMVKTLIKYFEKIQEIEDSQRDENGRIVLYGEKLKEYTLIKKQIGELNSILEKRVGRNDPCSCGSGIKYKKCCGRYRE